MAEGEGQVHLLLYRALLLLLLLRRHFVLSVLRLSHWQLELGRRQAARHRRRGLGHRPFQSRRG